MIPFCSEKDFFCLVKTFLISTVGSKGLGREVSTVFASFVIGALGFCEFGLLPPLPKVTV
jgi:hypothetical protein